MTSPPSRFLPDRHHGSGRRAAFLDPPPVPGALGVPFGLAAGIASIAIAGAAGGGYTRVTSVILLVVVIDTIAVTSTRWATIATTTGCWLLHASLVLDPIGELTTSAQSFRDALMLVLNMLGAAFLASSMRIAGRQLATTAPSDATTARDEEAVAMDGDPDMISSVAATLNAWNALTAAETCDRGPHGRMRAARNPDTTRMNWRCHRCGHARAVTRGQLIEALDLSVSQGL